MKRSKLLTTVTGAVLAAVLMYAVLSRAGFSNIPKYLTAMDYGWILLSIVVYTLEVLLRAYRWKAILGKNSISVRLTDAFFAYNLGNSLNILLPAKIGDVGRSYFLKKKYGCSYSDTLPSVFLDRVFDVIGVYIVILACSIYILTGVRLTRWFYNLFVLGIIALLAVLVVLEVLMTRRGLLDRLKDERIKRLLRALLDGFAGTFKEKKSFLSLSLCSAVIWLLEGIVAVMVFQALGQQLDLIVIVFTTLFATLAKIVPVTPGGIGVFEGTMVILLSLFGFSKEAGAIVSTVNHLVMNLYTIFIGVYVILMNQIKVSKLID